MKTRDYLVDQMKEADRMGGGYRHLLLKELIPLVDESATLMAKEFLERTLDLEVIAWSRGLDSIENQLQRLHRLLTVAIFLNTCRCAEPVAPSME